MIIQQGKQDLMMIAIRPVEDGQWQCGFFYGEEQEDGFPQWRALSVPTEKDRAIKAAMYIAEPLTNDRTVRSFDDGTMVFATLSTIEAVVKHDDDVPEEVRRAAEEFLKGIN